jgi:hypothetical protein
LLGVAIHATGRGVDFLSSYCQSGNGRRKVASCVLIIEGLQMTEIGNRIGDKAEPGGSKSDEY